MPVGIAAALLLAAGTSAVAAPLTAPDEARAKNAAVTQALFEAGGLDIESLRAELDSAASTSWVRASTERRLYGAALRNLALPTNPVVTSSELEDVADTAAGWDVHVRTQVGMRNRVGRAEESTRFWRVSLNEAGAVAALAVEDPSLAPSDVGGATTSAVDVPFVPGPAWGPDGSPTLALARPYWRLLSRAALVRAAGDGTAAACVPVNARGLAPFRSEYFALTRNASGASFCFQAGALKADGRWNDLLASVDRSQTDDTVPLALPRVAAVQATQMSHARTSPRRRYFSTVVVHRKAGAVKRAHGAYSRSAAMNYANQWWNGRNPNYPSYSNDCANYVSQLLDAGGFTPNYGAGWWPSLPRWTVSQDLRNWLWNNSYAYGVSPQNATTGDTVFYDYSSNGSIDHSSMVNTDNGGWNYVTQHSTDYLNRAVADQIQANPGISIGFFKVDHTN